MDSEFMTDLQKEGENPFENKEEEQTETAPESSPEDKPEEEKAASQEAAENTPVEEAVPFHKHPRWQERERELESLRAEIESLKSSTKEEAPTENSRPDEWFKEAFGENEELWEKFSRYNASLKEETKAEVLQALEDRQRQSQDELQSLSAKFNADIQELKDEGKSFDEEELRQVAAEYFPTDENGIVSLRKAYGIYDAIRSRETDDRSRARKDLAAKTTSDDRGESQPKDYVTSAEARRMSWT